MGQEPDQIRGRIEQTRNEMGETIDALGYKADVPARAKDKVTDRVERARESVAGTVDSIKGAVGGGASSVKEAAPDRRRCQGARHAVGVAQKTRSGSRSAPSRRGFWSACVAVLARRGRAHWRDRRRRQGAAAEVGQEGLEHGKQIAKDVAETAASAAEESAAQHADELRRRQTSTHRPSDRQSGFRGSQAEQKAATCSLPSTA